MESVVGRGVVPSTQVECGSNFCHCLRIPKWEGHVIQQTKCIGSYCIPALKFCGMGLKRIIMVPQGFRIEVTEEAVHFNVFQLLFKGSQITLLTDLKCLKLTWTYLWQLGSYYCKLGVLSKAVTAV